MKEWTFTAWLLLSAIVNFNPASSSPSHQWAVRLRVPTTSSPSPSVLNQSNWNEEKAFFLTDDIVARKIAESMNLTLVERLEIGELCGFYLFEWEKKLSANAEFSYHPASIQNHSHPLYHLHRTLNASKHIHWFQYQEPRLRVKRMAIPKGELIYGSTTVPSFNDPLFSSEWYLFDSVNSLRNQSRHDLNVFPVWEKSIRGRGVVVAVIDDGLEFSHPDISSSYIPEGSYDFVANTNDPRPKLNDDYHGTRCAGEIVSKPNNVLCGVGVSFESKVSGIRLISEPPTDSQEAKAFTYKFHLNHIYTSSWGPNDDGKTIDGPSELLSRAFRHGTAEGRSGLGSLYVFAGGNGGMMGDDCNFDGYANSIYTITIGSIDKDGKMSAYGETCAAQFAVVPVGQQNQAVSTTDISSYCTDPPCCTSSHSGTSAAAPLAAGVLALVMSLRPTLQWRDFQHILVQSSCVTDPLDPGWHLNGAGFHFNHKYGFGKIDADRAQSAARQFDSVPASVEYEVSSNDQISLDIRSGGSPGLEVFIDVPQQAVSDAIHPPDSLIPTYLEYAQVYVDIKHKERRFLSIDLISPNGTLSHLAIRRPGDDSDVGIRHWTFSSVSFWGENPTGKWTLRIIDGREQTLNAKTPAEGKLRAWKLILHGIPCERKLWIPRSDHDGFQCPWETSASQHSVLVENSFTMSINRFYFAILVLFAILFMLVLSKFVNRLPLKALNFKIFTSARVADVYSTVSLRDQDLQLTTSPARSPADLTPQFDEGHHGTIV